MELLLSGASRFEWFDLAGSQSVSSTLLLWCGFSATRFGLRFFLVEMGLTQPVTEDILPGFPRSSDGSEEVFHENVFRQVA